MSTHNIHLKYRTPKTYPTIISIVPPGVALIVTFRGSNYRCLEQIFMVPKGFEPSKVGCTLEIEHRLSRCWGLWRLVATLLHITKTRLYYFDPLKPHFYIVKLGFTGVYIIFLIFAQTIDCGYLLEPPRRGCSNEYPQSMF